MLHRAAVEPSTLELLMALNGLPELADFALTGGTNLTLRYGHRLSVDLDFFTPRPFNTQALIERLGQSFSTLLLLEEAVNTVSLSIDGIKVDFIAHQYPTRPYEWVETIRFFRIEDVIAMKLGAIARRGAKKDFWDLAELIRHYSIQEMLLFYGEKYSNADPFFVVRSLSYFTDAEHEEDPNSLNNLTWGEVKDEVDKAVRVYLQNSMN